MGRRRIERATRPAQQGSAMVPATGATHTLAGPADGAAGPDSAQRQTDARSVWRYGARYNRSTYQDVSGDVYWRG